MNICHDVKTANFNGRKFKWGCSNYVLSIGLHDCLVLNMWGFKKLLFLLFSSVTLAALNTIQMSYGMNYFRLSHWDSSNMCTYVIDVQSVADKMVGGNLFESPGIYFYFWWEPCCYIMGCQIAWTALCATHCWFNRILPCGLATHCWFNLIFPCGLQTVGLIVYPLVGHTLLV